MEFDKVPAHKPPKGGACDTFHGKVIEDPFRPLEDLDSPETRAWADYQQERFEQYIDGYKDRAKRAELIKKRMDFSRESIPARYGNFYFSHYNPGTANQDVFQVRDSIDGTPRVLINPNDMDEKGLTALKTVSPSPGGKYVAYVLSENGDDEEIIRVLNVETGENLPDVIKDARFTSITWDKDSNNGFTYNYPAHDGSKRSIVKHHVIGDDQSKDKTIFSYDDSDIAVAGFYRFNEGEYDLVDVRLGTERYNGVYIRQTGEDSEFKEVFKPGFAKFSPCAEVDGLLYIVTTHDAPNGKLVAVDPANPSPENWKTIIPESKTDILNSVFKQQGKIFANYSHQAADQLRIYDLQGKSIGEVPIPEKSSIGIGKRNVEDTKLLMKVHGYTQPGSLYQYDIENGDMQLIKPTSAKDTLEGCTVKTIWTESKDGTKVPMTMIYDPKRVPNPQDGSAAVRLYGYGGFSVPLEPGYSHRISEWVKQGGVFVVANLRGGSEFGQDWYNGGRQHNKQNTFDDFIACAETLIDEGYTSNERLVIEGGSNGGLLTAACMIQRPDLYGAVISAVPVLDMLRYHLATFGALWKSDYGDPTVNEDDFKVTMGYSPIHNVKEDVKYPPLLLMTADHDSRVVPWHAYKFAATLQEKSPESLTLMRVEKNAGHGAGKPIDKVIDEMIDANVFIERTIGPINQLEYKKQSVSKPAVTQKR